MSRGTPRGTHESSGSARGIEASLFGDIIGAFTNILRHEGGTDSQPTTAGRSYARVPSAHADVVATPNLAFRDILRYESGPESEPTTPAKPYVRMSPASASGLASLNSEPTTPRKEYVWVAPASASGLATPNALRKERLEVGADNGPVASEASIRNRDEEMQFLLKKLAETKAMLAEAEATIRVYATKREDPRNAQAVATSDREREGKGAEGREGASTRGREGEARDTPSLLVGAHDVLSETEDVRGSLVEGHAPDYTDMASLHSRGESERDNHEEHGDDDDDDGQDIGNAEDDTGRKHARVTGEEDDHAIAQANDPLEMLSDPNAFVADFRVHAHPRGVEYSAGSGGEPKLEKEEVFSVMEKIEQSYLRVPFGAHLKATVSTSPSFAKDELVESFTIVIDLRYAEKSGPQLQQSVFPLVSFGADHRDPQVLLDSARMVALSHKDKKGAGKAKDGKARRSSLVLENTTTETSTSLFRSLQARPAASARQESDHDVDVSAQASPKAVEPNRWHRMAIAVSIEDKAVKIFLDGALHRVETFQTVSEMLKLKLQTKQVHLFAGKADEMLEVHVRRLEIHPRYLAGEELMAKARLPRLPETVINVIGSSEQERRSKLCLNRVVEHTVPIWKHASFHALFGDRFSSRPMGSGPNVHESMQVLVFLAEKVINSPAGVLAERHNESLPTMSRVLDDLKQTKSLARKLSRVIEAASPEALLSYLKQLGKLLNDLQVNRSLFVPVGTYDGDGEHDAMLVVHNDDNQTYTITVVNLEGGLAFHPVSPWPLPSKYKFNTAIPLEKVPRSKALDMAWWMNIVMLRSVQAEASTPESMYELLGWLKDEPFDTTVDNLMKRPATEWWRRWRSQVVGASSYFRTVKESVFQECSRQGVSRDALKAFALELRRQALVAARNDVVLVKTLGHAERLSIIVGVQQTCFAAVKASEVLFKEERDAVLAKQVLDQILPEMEALVEAVRAKENDEEYRTLPPPVLDLNSGQLDWEEAAKFPFFESFKFDKDDAAGMEGDEKPESILPVESIHHLPLVKNFEDCIHTLRRMRRVLTELHCYQSNVRHYHRQVMLLVENLFTQTFSVPLGPKSRKQFTCLWSRESILFSEQKEVLALLGSFSRHYVTAVSATSRDAWNHGTVITVLGAMVAMCDGVLRQPAKDWQENEGGVTNALNGGFGVDIDLFSTQSEACPVYSTPVLAARAAILDYFSEVEASGGSRHKIWSWEVEGYTIKLQDQRDNQEFAQAVMGDLNLGVRPIEFAYSQCAQTKELFPEFETFRDLCFWWKWSMCPMLSNSAEEGGDAYRNNLHYEIDQQNKVVLVMRGRETILPIDAQMPPTRQRFPQYAHPNEVLREAGIHDAQHGVHSEDDVLHRDRLPKFNNSLGPRDSELILSYLTVPYLRIPLLLRFFAGEDRFHSLKEREIQNLLEHALVEPGKYLPRLELLDAEKSTPKQVPSEKPELIATTYGLLLNELQHSPDSILQPMKELLSLALKAASSSINDKESLNIGLYVVRLVARTVSFARYLLRCWRGDVPALASWATVIDSSDKNKVVLDALSSDLHRMLLPVVTGSTAPKPTASSSSTVDPPTGSSSTTPEAAASSKTKKKKKKAQIASTTTETKPEEMKEKQVSEKGGETDTARSTPSKTIQESLMARLEEIQDKCGLFCALGRKQKKTLKKRIEETELLSYIETSNNIHAHLLLIYNNCEVFDMESSQAALSSLFYLMTHHTWSNNKRELGCSEKELMQAIHEVRLKCDDYLKRAADEAPAELIKVCQFVYMANVGKENPHNAWRRVENRPGRYVCLKEKELLDDVSKIGYASQKRDKFTVEIDLHNLELRIAGNCLKALDECIAVHTDFRALIGENPLTMQCLVKPDRKNCFEREVVGMETPLYIQYWNDATDVDNINRDGFTRDYLPDEPAPGEEWIHELFEPIRTKMFIPQGEPPIEFRLPEPPYDSHVQVAVLVGVHPRFKGPWFDVVAVKEYDYISVFQVVQHGTQYWRKFRYTSNATLAYHFVQPNLEPNKAWLPWSRHASPPDPGEDNPLPQSEGRSCVIKRCIPEATNENKLETFVPKRFLSGLIPEVLCDLYVFWQDDDECEKIRGYQVEESVPKVDAKTRAVSVDLLRGADGRVSAKISLVESNEVLLNWLYAPPNTALTSLGNTLCRAERASHILVWARDGQTDGIHRVQLMNLKMAFNCKTAPDSDQKRLYSADFPNMFVTESQFPATRFLNGVPHFVPLCTSERECVVCVPNVSFTRPDLRDRPFSTELVLNPEDKDWKKHCVLKYFSYKLHASGSSLIPSCLSATFYLFVLKVLHREYEEACSMMAGISCDAQLSKQEELIFKLLREASIDKHPNAHACRVKVTLAFADCPIELPWDIREEAAAYFRKLRHVSAGCRLNPEEEQALISDCKTFDKVQQVWEQAKRFYQEESLNRWWKLLSQEEVRFSAASQHIRQAEDFFSSMSEMARVKTGVFSHRERHMQHLKNMLFGKKINASDWKLLLNRDALLTSRANHLPTVACQFSPRARMKKAWQHIWNDAALLAGPTEGIFSERDLEHLEGLFRQPIYEDEKNFGKRQALEFAGGAMSGEMQQEMGITHIFFLLYLMLSGDIHWKAKEITKETFCTLLFYAFDDACKGGFIASILNILCANPQLHAGLPKIDDFIFRDPSEPSESSSVDEDDDEKEEEGEKETKPSSDSEEEEDGGSEEEERQEMKQGPMAFLQAVHQYLLDNKDKLRPEPPTRRFLPQSAVLEMGIPNVSVLDDCPSLSVNDLNQKHRDLKCHIPSWSGVLVGTLDNEKGIRQYDVNRLAELCDRPLLRPCRGAVKEMPRPECKVTLPFDTTSLKQDATANGREIIERFENQAEQLAKMESETATYFLEGLGQADFSNKSKWTTIHVEERIRTVTEITEKIRTQKSEDLALFSEVETCLDRLVNATHEASPGNLSMVEVEHKVLQISGHRPRLQFRFLVLTLLSTHPNEWQRVNPTITSEIYEHGLDLLAVGLLHGTRIAAAVQVIQELQSLLSILEHIKQGQEPDKGTLTILQQKASAIASLLSAQRTYVENKAGSRTYNPHFLVFEFQQEMVLRTRQVEIVKDIVGAVGEDPPRSVVKQMIMGAGKTTVVSPLLALLFSEPKKLVLQVVPPALLEFSREVMRSALGNTLGLRVYTFSFSRSDGVDGRLFSKLSRAAEEGAVVMTTPVAVKSLMLKFVENLTDLSLGMPKQREKARQVKDAAKVFELLQRAVVVYDEVDTVLDPLKSELNFPFGTKDRLPMSPQRWELPLFLLDCFLRAGTETPLVDDLASAVQEHVRNIYTSLQAGFKNGMLQRRPHWILLSHDFYIAKLRKHFVELALVWCFRQGLDIQTFGWMRDYVVRDQMPGDDDKDEINANFLKRPLWERRTLNLVRSWIHTMMPHVLRKVDRVSFGLMTKEDCERALRLDPLCPRSRLDLAIPFVGKDCPSSASEFAHPDVTVGLTVLAYRYEGLRMDDFTEIIRTLLENLSKELGNVTRRPSALRFENWVNAAGGVVMTQDSDTSDAPARDSLKNKESTTYVLPLHSLQRASREQFKKVYDLLRMESSLIYYFLGEFVFWKYMRYHSAKFSASAQELGSSMLFSRRVGFSGTPSSLIPIDMNKCQFEPGSEARILRTLTDSAIVDTVDIPNADWRPDDVLDMLVDAGDRFNALIDTGALITGKTNLEVAEYLLRKFMALPPAKQRKSRIEGVVYLDESDRKMILVGSTMQSLELAECGIGLQNRFVFYDQVHTVGMDIKHSPNARAALTLGKDMVFRDLAQGAYRMRGIESGQSISYFVSPEVKQLVYREMGKYYEKTKSQGVASLQIADFVAWLILSSTRHEQLQANQLLVQNVSNVYRKIAFKQLVDQCSLLCRALRTDSFLDYLKSFREPVSNDVSGDISRPTTILEKIIAIKEEFKPMLASAGVREMDLRDETLEHAINKLAESGLEAEAVLEQEQEQEQEQQQEKEQEIEIEKVADLQYVRTDERAEPWNFRELLEFADGKMEPFYPLSQFKLWGRDPINFPTYMAASKNYYKIAWSGERRIKNVCMVLDIIPTEKGFEEYAESHGTPDPEIQKQQEQAEEALWDLLYSACLSCAKEGTVSEQGLKDLVLSLTGQESDGHRNDEKAWLTRQRLDEAARRTCGHPLNRSHLSTLMRSKHLRHTHGGRYFVVVSLAEAESIRRILHLRGKDQRVIGNGSTTMCLRNLADFSNVVDASQNYREPSLYQLQRAQQLLRFFDGELCFSFAQQLMLVYSLELDFHFQRQVFFEAVIARRRRQQLQSEGAPVDSLFTYQTEADLAYTNCLRHVFGGALKTMGMRIDTAFDFFDTSRDGELNGEEAFAMLKWIGLRPKARQVLRFLRHVDVDKNETVSLSEFKDFLDITAAETGKSISTPKERPQPEGKEELDRERKEVEREAQQRKEKAEALRNTHEARVRDGGSTVAGADGSKEAKKPNPDLSTPQKVRWEYTDGTYPSFSACHGCTEFQNDPDGTLKYSDENDEMSPFKHFLRLEAKSHIGYTLPKHMSGTEGEHHKSETAAAGIRQYTFTTCFRLCQMPGMKCPLLVLGENEVSIFVCQSGLIDVQLASSGDTMTKDEDLENDDDAVGQGGESASPGIPTVHENEWSVLSVAVDVDASKLQIFLDGQASNKHENVDLPTLNSTSELFLFGTGKKNLQLQVNADVKFSQLNTSALLLQQVLEVHVPMGVWRCPCKHMNGPGLQHCGGCFANKSKSAARPEKDMDPEHPGLTVVVQESFNEIVLDGNAHVFLDVTADWCGPSRQMKPEWHYLANLLADHPDIRIATMDSDANEVDRGYLPETYIPNLKLFLKGDRLRCINYPDGLERKVSGFVKFLEDKVPNFKYSEFMQGRLGEYLEKKDVGSIVRQAQLAVAGQIKKRVARMQNRNTQGGAAAEERLVMGVLDTLEIGRFLANYFSDREVFLVEDDADASAETIAANIADSLSQNEGLRSKVLALITSVKPLLEKTLAEALPEDPVEFLGKRLSQTEVVSPTAKKSEVEQISSGSDLKGMYNKARFAISSQDVKTMRSLLEEGLPARKSRGGDSLSCLAAGFGALEILKLLYEYGANLNEEMEHGKSSLSALEIAAMHGCKEVADFLLQSGVPFRSALHFAVNAGYSDITREMLFSYGANPDVKVNGRSAVTLAVLGNHDTILRDLLQLSSQVEKHLDDELCSRLGLAPGSNLMHVAAKFHHIDSIQAIKVKWGKLTKEENQDKKTPFDVAHLAVKPYLDSNFLESLELLRKCALGRFTNTSTADQLRKMFEEKSANANAQDVRGWTALMASALAHDVEACKVLLTYGAKWSTQNRSEQTALFWACASGAREVQTVLEEKGALLSAREEQGLERIRELVRTGNDEVKSLMKVNRDTRVALMQPSVADGADFYKAIMHRMSMDLSKLDIKIPQLLPPGYAPDMSLEDSILALEGKVKVMEDWDFAVPGDCEFPDWKSLMSQSKLFVQERVAWGDPLPPFFILALHLYTIPCNLFRLCNKAMRDDNQEELKKYRVFLWYLWNALKKMSVKQMTVFRGIQANPAIILRGVKNGLLLWPSFSSTSNSSEVASAFMARAGTGGVIFKIKSKSTREIMAYSYKPMERELLLPPQTWFEVKGVYPATDYNLEYGLEHTGTSERMDNLALVPMRERSREGLTENDVILLVMEEVDDSQM